jgi:hypothetical protein
MVVRWAVAPSYLNVARTMLRADADAPMIDASILTPKEIEIRRQHSGWSPMMHATETPKLAYRKIDKCQPCIQWLEHYENWLWLWLYPE